MKKIFVGIDISKEWLDFSKLKKEEEKSNYIGQYKNTPSGIEEVLEDLISEHGKQGLWICFEHTGVYGLLLSSMLEEKGIKYSAVPALEIINSLGITRGKNDKVDSGRIAEYASTHSHKLKETQLPGEELMEVKQLLTFRSQLVKVRTQFKNSIKSHEITVQATGASYITKSLSEKIKELDKEIGDLEKEIGKVLKKKPEIKDNLKYMKSVKGVGLIISAQMLVTTLNFTAFDSARKYNSYTGIAPFENSSGKSRKKSKTSNLANKTIKTLLSNGANSAIQWDPQLRKFYQKKVAEGKNEQSVKNAVACKLVGRIFSVVRRQSEYVVFAH